MNPLDSWLVAAAFLCALLAIAATSERMKTGFVTTAIILFTGAAAASLFLKMVAS